MKTALIRKLSVLCIVFALAASSVVVYGGEGCGAKKGCEAKAKQCDGEKKESCKKECDSKKEGCCKKAEQKAESKEAAPAK